jgi:hypothetical protein
MTWFHAATRWRGAQSRVEKNSTLVEFNGGLRSRKLVERHRSRVIRFPVATRRGPAQCATHASGLVNRLGHEARLNAFRPILGTMPALLDPLERRIGAREQRGVDPDDFTDFYNPAF